MVKHLCLVILISRMLELNLAANIEEECSIIQDYLLNKCIAEDKIVVLLARLQDKLSITGTISVKLEQTETKNLSDNF